MKRFQEKRQTPTTETIMFLIIAMTLAIGASVAKSFDYTTAYALARLLSVFAAISFAVCGVVVLIIVIKQLK